MNIDITEYLTHNEIKNIVEEAVRKNVNDLFRDSRELEISIANIAYRYINEKLEETYATQGIDYKQLLYDKIKKVVNEMSSYVIFHEKDVCYPSTSTGQIILEETVKNSRSLIEEKVKDIINNYDFEHLIVDNTYDIVVNVIADMMYIGAAQLSGKANG